MQVSGTLKSAVLAVRLIMSLRPASSIFKGRPYLKTIYFPDGI